MLFQLILANLKMIFRNRQALFWALAFPLIFVAVFGLFRLDEPPQADVLLVDQSKDDVSLPLAKSLETIQGFSVREVDDEQKARTELANGHADLLIIFPKDMASKLAQQDASKPLDIVLLYDRSNATSPIFIGTVQRFVEETNKAVVQAPTLLELKAEGVQSRRFTYFDFLLPGFVGMGVMSYSIIGIASAMALYRQQKILKRILATPLRVRTFFASQIIAYLLLSILQSLIIIAAGVFLFHGHVYGNLLWLLVLVVIGNIIFLNLGFITGALARNVEAASGLGNAVSIPMMFFSGVFFPTETLPNVMESIVKYLPLTPLLTAMRGVALSDVPFWRYPTEMIILGVWIAVTSVLAVRLFKFN